jgi:hypothetical protein
MCLNAWGDLIRPAFPVLPFSFPAKCECDWGVVEWVWMTCCVSGVRTWASDCTQTQVVNHTPEMNGEFDELSTQKHTLGTIVLRL